MDFKPAPHGWRAVYLDSGQRFTFPVVGWLIQESYRLDPDTDEKHFDPRPERRVIPGICDPEDGWEVSPIDTEITFLWKILAPGDPEPSEEEEREERERRAR